MRILKISLLSVVIGMTLIACGGTADILSTPVENIDNTPLKENELTEMEKKTWGHLDLVSDTIPGMSVNKAYTEIIKRQKGVPVIVAIIDSGIDIDHEDLDGVIWKNQDEVPNNGKDDDNNGYVDDVNGWNFLGDTYDEQMEYVRLLASGNKNHPRYTEAQAELQKEKSEAESNKNQYEQILQALNQSDAAVSNHLKKSNYTKAEVQAIQTEDTMLQQHKSVILQIFGFGFDTIPDARKELEDGIAYFTERLNYHFNLGFKGRKNGDDPDDYSSKFYGNNNVRPVKADESHGTHVAGIVAAERNNGLGVNGVANNVKIMPVRAVPNGDEYDKDIALAIRYAVNNISQNSY